MTLVRLLLQSRQSREGVVLRFTFYEGNSMIRVEKDQ